MNRQRPPLDFSALAKTVVFAFVAALAFLTALAEDPFTVVALPDTQIYNRNPQPNIFLEQTKWILESKRAENIVFVTQLGDFTDNGAKPVYWKNAIEGMSVLDGAIPYSVCFGNHDLHWLSENGDGTEACKNYASSKVRLGGETYNGASPDGLSFCQIFRAGPFTILHLNLKMAPGAKTLAWAKRVLDDNAGTPAFISTHDYLGVDANRDAVGEAIWLSAVKDSSNVFMVLNGHYSGEAKQLDEKSDGAKVVEMLADYQSLHDGGEGYLRLIKFIPDQGLIEVKTWSPHLKSFKKGPDSEFAFDAKFDVSKNSISIKGLHGFPPDAKLVRMSSSPKDALYSSSAPAVFNAAAEGFGEIRYQWMRNGQPVPDANGTSFSTSEEPPAGGKGTAFLLEASDATGSACSKKAHLTRAATEFKSWDY